MKDLLMKKELSKESQDKLKQLIISRLDKDYKFIYISDIQIHSNNSITCFNIITISETSNVKKYSVHLSSDGITYEVLAIEAISTSVYTRDFDKMNNVLDAWVKL